MSDKKYPSCAVGTWAWGNGLTGGNVIFGKKYELSQLKDVFKKAYDLGFTLWDTAEIYGMGSSEKILAQCIAEKKSLGCKVMVSTKYMPRPGKYKYGLIRQSLLNSLGRLGIDKADLYWLHLPVNAESNIKECIELLDEDLISDLGVSNFTLEQIKKADEILKKAGHSLGAVQNHFSLLRCDEEQLDIIKWCNENGVAYFSYMVMEQGALSCRYDDTKPFPSGSIRSFSFTREKFRRIRPLIDHIRLLGETYNISPSQIPVAWAVSKGTIPIIGLTKAEYAYDLAEGAALKLLPDDIAALEELAVKSGVVSKGFWEPADMIHGKGLSEYEN